jgi:hypothetical protein
MDYELDNFERVMGLFGPRLVRMLKLITTILIEIFA